MALARRGQPPSRPCGGRWCHAPCFVPRIGFGVDQAAIGIEHDDPAILQRGQRLAEGHRHRQPHARRQDRGMRGRPALDQRDARHDGGIQRCDLAGQKILGDQDRAVGTLGPSIGRPANAASTWRSKSRRSSARSAIRRSPLDSRTATCSVIASCHATPALMPRPITAKAASVSVGSASIAPCAAITPPRAPPAAAAFARPSRTVSSACVRRARSSSTVPARVSTGMAARVRRWIGPTASPGAAGTPPSPGPRRVPARARRPEFPRAWHRSGRR